MTYHTELDNKLVDELLCEYLVDLAMSQVILDEDVEERRYVTERHGSTVLLLYGSEVGHVYPLYSLLS